VNVYEAGILVYGANDMREQKIIEEKRDNKIGDEWEIAERPGHELTPSEGNSLAQVDRSSTYSDPDKDKQFNQKGSEGPATERSEISSEKIIQSKDGPDLKKDARKG
jgi:hypothetical protein